MKHEIAVIGMACEYPGASSPAELWASVLAGRQAFRALPSERTNLLDYHDPDPDARDKTYVTRAAVLENYQFDNVSFGVGGRTFRAVDMTHWLALDICARALADAGHPNGEGLPRRETGVLIGNTLTGEFARAELMRLRWPYVRRIINRALERQGWPASERGKFLADLERQYKQPFAEVTEESLAGGLSNTISGRICNYFDFKGGGYTMDGACASSLLAVANACRALAVHDLDVALAGGVDLSLDPFELVGFARMGALASDAMRVYDRKATGFLPGEGCGMVVLCRLEDALKKGERVHAVITGWGISSDGKGGITRPETDGQLIALERAYAKAELAPAKVVYFEGHGTGTAVGDAAELRALIKLREGAEQTAFLGSVKANIGHTKAAAGAAGLIKGIMALANQIIPPATACDVPHELIAGDQAPVQVPRQGMLWPRNQPLAVGVSAFGFGGINAHLVLQSTNASRKTSLTEGELRLLASRQDCELFLLSEENPTRLSRRVGELSELAARLSRAELSDLAAALTRNGRNLRLRAAIVAATPEQLAVSLNRLGGLLGAGETSLFDERAGLFLAEARDTVRIGYLFPGQGAPVRSEAGAAGIRFPWIQKRYEATFQAGTASAAEAAHVAITLGAAVCLELLHKVGMQASVVLGHSLGELVALHHAGVMDAATLVELARARGRAIHENGAPGSMLSAAAPATEVRLLLEGREVVIAAHNTDRQTVLSGSVEELHAVEAALNLARIQAAPLQVTHAFHSPLVAAAVPALRKLLTDMNRAPIEGTVYSSITGGLLAADTSVVDLLCDQLTRPVLFYEAYEAAAAAVDLWIEVGPGFILSRLVRDMGGSRIVATDMGGGLGGVLKAVGAAYVLGHGVDPKVLFADRYTKPFDETRKLSFLANPCEAAPPPEPVLPRVITRREVRTEDEHDTIPSIGAEQLLQDLIARRNDMPLESLRSDMRLLDDLHMSSIMVAEVITEAARRLGRLPPQAPTELANVTLAEAAEIIESSPPAGDLITEHSPVGMGAWYRAFTIRWQDRPTDWAFPELEGGSLTVFGPVDLPLVGALQSIERQRLAGDAVVVVLASDEDAAEYLPRGARLAAKLKSAFIIVSEQAEAASFARCYAAEYPQSRVLTLTISFDDTVANRLVEELAGLSGFLHVRYDSQGHRQLPLWETVPTGKTGALEELGDNDVLLVSAGGKGISAECALAIFRRTGVSLAILGRGDPAWDEELAANLDRFRREGSHFAYYRADVVDALAVSTAVAEAEIRLGPVTAILHGAGINQPKTIPNLTSEEMSATIGPKVDGLKNLLAAVSPDRLKLLVTFGSIISHLGLEGEAHYALANAIMAREVETFAALWPNCRSLNLEWSVWSGLGMGERLGRVDSLLQQGITPITPDQGSVLFEQILDDPDLQGSLIVSGRFGLPRTVAFAGSELPFARFLEQSRLFYPGIELVVDSELGLDTDPYLADHVYEGTQILPAVIAMEAMTQAATALHGGEDPPTRILDLRMERPIIIPHGQSTVIRLAALVHGNGSVEVGLRCQETGFHVDHFRALFDFQPGEPAPEPPEVLSALDLVPLPLPQEALYGPIFFHQGRFRRLRNYHLLSAWACVAEIGGGSDESWFGRFLPDTLYLGDPGRRDAVLHGIQACIPHKSLLPLACGEWRLFRQRKGDQLFYAREIHREDGAYTYDVDVVGEDGLLDECWRGLVFKEVYDREYRASWHPFLHPPYLQWILAENSRFDQPVIVVETSEDEPPRRLMESIKRRLDLTFLAQSGHTNEIPFDESFFCYAGGLVAGCLSDGLMACDLVFIEPIENSPQADWLGEDETALAETIAEQAGISLDEAWSRQLAARACMEKVGLPADTPLSLSPEIEGPLIRLTEGGVEIATLVLRVPAGPNLILAVLYELKTNQPGE